MDFIAKLQQHKNLKNLTWQLKLKSKLCQIGCNYWQKNRVVCTYIPFCKSCGVNQPLYISKLRLWHQMKLVGLLYVQWHLVYDFREKGRVHKPRGQNYLDPLPPHAMETLLLFSKLWSFDGDREFWTFICNHNCSYTSIKVYCFWHKWRISKPGIVINIEFVQQTKKPVKWISKRQIFYCIICVEKSISDL